MSFANRWNGLDSLPRICLLTETYFPLVGGGETQARILAESLAAKGFKVIIVTRRVNLAFKKTEDIGGLTVYRIPPIGLGPLKRWKMLLWSLVTLVRMRRQYDIIFVSGFKALGISAVLIGKLFGKACILKADSNGEMSGDFFAGGLKKIGLLPSSCLFRMFLRVRNKILRAADSFVAITHGIADEFRSQGISARVIHAVSNSVDTKKFHPVSEVEKDRLRNSLAVPKKEILVAYAGRLVSYKGLPLLMKVAAELQREHENVGFVLLGSGGLDIHNCEAELKEYVRVNRLETVICFPGDVHNVHEYLQASDIFVFPTEKDAFPLALVEAMACGLPVISTPIGGISEIITHGQNGLIVEVGSFQQLYEAISKVIGDKALSVSIGTAAAQTVKERYSVEIITAKYIEIFRNAQLEYVAAPESNL